MTATQEKLWSDTRVALLWHAPAFAHIFYTMMDNTPSKHIAYFTEAVPIAATDGESLLLNPKTFFKYNLNERVFICVHEIMHCIWNHCGLMHQFYQRGKVAYNDGTSLPYNPQVMNVATDLVINDALIESKIGQFSKDWLHNTSIANGNDSAIDAYKKVFKESKAGKKPIAGVSFDEHLAPGTLKGKDPRTAAGDRNEAQWKAEVAAGVASAKAQGKMPGNLDRLLKELMEPQVAWQEHIQALFARKLGGGSYSWRAPDRRLIVRDIYSPGRSGFGCGTVVVGADTSGSIGDATLNMFFAEVAGMLEDLRPQRLVIVWCDASVNRVDELEDAMDLNNVRCKGAPGGGGTAFEPVFAEIEKMGLEPDALVYLTDGYGSFPKREPKYPVIWGSISPKDAVKYPFGDVVLIPPQAAA